MVYSLAADIVVLLHFLFILFVLLGGLPVLRWPRLAWLHLPAVGWGVLVEAAGWYCPLTPLENHFRRLAGEAGYSGDFIARYLLPVIYPDGLTRELQIALAAIVVILNSVFYILLIMQRGANHDPTD